MSYQVSGIGWLILLFLEIELWPVNTGVWGTSLKRNRGVWMRLNDDDDVCFA